MSYAIFAQNGALLLLRWLHLVSGGIWIGLTFSQIKNWIDMQRRSSAFQWLRWSALTTFLSGSAYLWLTGYSFHSSWGILILIGAALGSLMLFNVWFLTYPEDSEEPKKSERAKIAASTNVLFSIPLLFFMGAGSHLGISIDPEKGLWPLVLVLGAIMGALEINIFLGKMGPLKTVKGVVLSGVALTVSLYFAVEFLVR